MARKCLFCNGQELSKEHVFGQWLLKELNIVSTNISMTHANFAFTPLNERTQSYSKLVNGNVCKECNNGWMSELENTCKDLILSLVNFTLTEAILSEIKDKRKILAMWAFKNAIMLNYSVNYRKIVPKSHFRDLHKGEIPKNVIINIAYTKDRTNLNWVQNVGSPIILSNKLINKNKISEKNLGYKITYQLRHLLIKVVYYDLPFNNQYEDSGAITIYPNLYINDDFREFEDLFQYAFRGIIHEVR